MACLGGNSILRLPMPIKNVNTPKKAKTTVYMKGEEETLLNELLIKRLREKRKTDKSPFMRRDSAAIRERNWE